MILSRQKISNYWKPFPTTKLNYDFACVIARSPSLVEAYFKPTWSFHVCLPTCRKTIHLVSWFWSLSNTSGFVFQQWRGSSCLVWSPPSFSFSLSSWKWWLLADKWNIGHINRSRTGDKLLSLYLGPGWWCWPWCRPVPSGQPGGAEVSVVPITGLSGCGTGKIWAIRYVLQF